MGPKRGINTKSAAARDRKATKKSEATAKVQKEKEDKEWEDHDKHLARKAARKDADEKKKAEIAARKAESKILLEQENATLKSKATGTASKVTRHQIDMEKVQANAEQQKAEIERLAKKNITVQEFHATNINVDVAKMRAEGHIVASGIDEALEQLSLVNKEDREPVKNMKVLYHEFQDRRLPVLKAENPSLRLTQLREMIWKEWQKSPENPMARG